MKARLHAVVRGDRVVDLAVDSPLGAKVVQSPSGPVLHLINTAASLLEGDDLTIDLDLGDRARLTVLSVAAQVAHPCIDGGATTSTVRAVLGDGAALRWAPEPLIACAQSNHVGAFELIAGAGSRIDWTDELVLGRSGEDPAAISFTTTASVERAGCLVLEDGLELRPANSSSWRGPAVLGAARYLGTRLVWGAPGPATPRCSPPWTLLGDGCGQLARVVCSDPLDGRGALAAL